MKYNLLVVLVLSCVVSFGQIKVNPTEGFTISGKVKKELAMSATDFKTGRRNVKGLAKIVVERVK